MKPVSRHSLTTQTRSEAPFTERELPIHNGSDHHRSCCKVQPSPSYPSLVIHRIVIIATHQTLPSIPHNPYYSSSTVVHITTLRVAQAPNSLSVTYIPSVLTAGADVNRTTLLPSEANLHHAARAEGLAQENQNAVSKLGSTEKASRETRQEARKACWTCLPEDEPCHLVLAGRCLCSRRATHT